MADPARNPFADLIPQHNKAPAAPTKPTGKANPFADLIPQNARPEVTPPARTVGGALVQPFLELPGDYARITDQHLANLDRAVESWHNPGVINKALAAINTLGEGMAYVFSPVEAAFKAGFGDPFERTTGVKHSSEYIARTGSDLSQFAPWGKLFKAIGLLKDTSTLDAVLKTVAPTSRGVNAKRMGEMVRSYKGNIEIEKARVDHALEEFRGLIGSLPEPDRWAFVDAVETGRMQPNQQLQDAANFLRRLLDQRRDRIQSLGRNFLKNAVENYFPHMWKDPDKARAAHDAMAAEERAAAAKSPLTGRASFLKRRSIDSIKRGMEEHGLQPISDNPIDMVFHKINEMDRFYYGTKLIRQMKREGLIQFVPYWAKAPAGAVELLDKDFVKYMAPAKAEHFASFDARMREGMQKIVKFLGGKITIKLKHPEFKKGTRGWADPKTYEAVKRFGADEGTLYHEIGHLLDFRYGLSRFFRADPRAWKELEQLALWRTGAHGPQPTTLDYYRYVTNPEERMANLFHAYWHAPELLKQVAPTAAKILDKFLNHRDLKALFESVKPAMLMSNEQMIEHFPGLRYMGKYYAPEPAARIVNNYLSKGLGVMAPGTLAKKVRQAGNFLNMFQLGLSGFHWTFVTQDVTISRIALALEQLARGEVGRAAKTFASAPAASVTGLIKGGKLRHAILDPEGATPQMQKMVQAITEGGGRINMDQFYRSTGSGNFVRAWKNGTITRELVNTIKDEHVKAPFTLATRLMETIMAPLMDWYVPRQKLGVFYEMAADWLRRNPNATTREMQTAMQEVWDSVDNRMGQMVYDNLFWNKTTKDLAFITVRSVGWNVGTLRELGGAVVDTAGQAVKLSQGERAELTHRMAYAIALPLVVAMEGAIATYLYTGHGPTEGKDYFFPPTGRLTPSGAPERVNIPSYVKDVMAFNAEPGQTVANKVHPLLSMGVQWWQNQDYYGAAISNPQDPVVKQVWDWAKWVSGQAEPFTFRSYFRQQKEGGGASDLLSFFGVQAAPGYITDPEMARYWELRRMQPAIRKKLRQEMRDQSGPVPTTAHAPSHTTAKRHKKGENPFADLIPRSAK